MLFERGACMGSVRYDFEPNIADPNAAQLVYCALSRYDDTWHSVLHSHAHAELFYCLNGYGELVIDNKKHRLNSGDFFLINPGVEHTERSTKEGKLEYIVIGVGNVQFSDASGRIPPFRLIRDRSNRHEFQPYFEDIIREISRQREGCLFVCQSILTILFTKARRQTHVAIVEGPVVRGKERFQRIKEMLDERYTKDITLDVLADFAHISKYHLEHMFKAYYGISPMQYLCRRRVEEARYLLANTDNSLSQIYQQVGFSSPSYFCQAFKRLTGVTPSEYRKSRAKR